MFCVVAYDMPDNRRRARLFKLMKGFGLHTQFSVFECELHDHQYKMMLAAIQATIVEAEDNIKVYVLCHDCLKIVRLMGTAQLVVRPTSIII